MKANFSIPFGSAPRNRRKARRPKGVSRRQKRRQLGFETLEDRRVMSAQSPLAEFAGNVADGTQLQVESYSSATEAGQLQILLNELYWASLSESAIRSGIAASSIPTDPLLNAQWHLINNGQEVGNPDFQAIFGIPGEDLNIAPVFNNTDLTGAGVTVAVIDSALQFNHPDLAANVSSTLGLNTFSGATGPTSGIASPHGTSVAGLIGAVADNGIGGSGVAPGATLVPIQFLDFAGFGNPLPNATVNAFRYETDQIDITNNSWGPFIDLNGDGIGERGITNLTFAETQALRDSVIFGRDGKGVIHVFASGNGAGSPFDPGFNDLGNLGTASYNGYVNSRYTIGVTGVDHDGSYNNIDGTVTSFAEAGTSVLVAAPTGSNGEGNSPLGIGNDIGIGSGIVTTDLTGEAGFNISPDPISGQEFDRDFLADIDYTSRFGGTSSAAPLVTGVIALMLEANPELSYRDVQEILLRSARQNAEFEVPSALLPGPTQNTWIQNQMPVFHDPDPFNAQIAPSVQTQAPTLDPNIGRTPTGPNATFAGLSNNHFAPTPQTLTNGAGYTVSQGRGVYGEEIGYAHGVVDAELAVQLAQQWTTKSQALANELTFTSFISPSGGFFINLPAAEVGNQASGFQFVPGGLGGLGGFVGFWNEYFSPTPFAGNPTFDSRGGYVNLTVPDNNTMSIENVGIKITANGGSTEFLDHVRVLLVSPDGTHHDMNPFFVEQFSTPFSLANGSPATFLDSTPGNIPGSVDTNPGGPLVLEFNSNRSWGERSDDALIFDPTTLEPFVGQPDQAWQLHFENYSNEAYQITGIEVDWHGTPIGADTQRIQGLVGVDDNQDDAFNFSRVTSALLDLDNDPTTNRFGEVVNFIDQTHESMGANVTVQARRASDGVIVDQFVTGADGNYYFDLVPDDYILSVVDAAGREALDDSTQTADGFLKRYQAEWTINEEFFRVWDYDANLEVPLEADGSPRALLDGIGNETVYHVQNINFLLNPGDPPLDEAIFTGTVFADTNGDGLFNADDVAVPGISVFGDVNRNGQFDSGEVIVTTNDLGVYDLTIPTTFASVINVGVIPPIDWTPTNPADGFSPFFIGPGTSLADVDFALLPPAFGSGDGTNGPGTLLGVVFEDANTNATRDSGETGVSGIRVYIDANGTGVFDAGDTSTTTNVHGAFVFTDVPAGIQSVRIDVVSPLQQITPLANSAFTANLSGGGTISTLLFGIGNSATLDFGDLPSSYAITTLANDGARHPRGIFFLGARIDAELDGQPSDDALADDAVMGDEDGIVFDPIIEGTTTTGRFVATASRHGGYLTGWMDFNGDGDFDDVIDGVSERLVMAEPGGPSVTRLLLDAGSNEVLFEVPATIDADTIFARFRFSEFDIDSLTGLALIGEVEDYAITPVTPIPQIVIHGPDFNEDGDVDGGDFLSWQRGFNKPGPVAVVDGDSNSDGDVDGVDLADWSREFGTGTTPAPLVVGLGDFNSDGDTDGGDFLTWQRGFGDTVGGIFSNGDADSNGDINQEDLTIWGQTFGTETPGGSSAGAPIGSTFYVAPSIEPQVLASPDLGSNVARTEIASPLASKIGFEVVAETRQAARIEALSGRAITSLVRDMQEHSDSLRPLADRFQSSRAEARLERRDGEQFADRTRDASDLGSALRDRALDHLFAGRRNLLGSEELEEAEETEETTANAFAAALGEQIDWRFV